MGNVLKKNFPSCTCLQCGEVTGIHLSKGFRSLVGQNKTLKECLKLEQSKTNKIHNVKNAQVQTLHLVIKRLLDLMDDEQKKKAREINQFMRDELKHAEIGFKND